MEAQGARLKKARLEKGLSLEEVHKGTKIDLKILKALEEDSFINLNPVYLKGFLRMYCKFLDLNPAEFIPSYREPAYIFERGGSSSVGGPEKAISFLKNVSVRILWLKKFRLGKIRRVAFFVLLVSLAAFALFKAGRFISGGRLRAAQKKALHLHQVSKAPVKEKEQPAAEALPVVSLIRLGIQAKQDCWVNLKIDGKVVQQGWLKKGRSESWQAKEKAELSLGDAGAVVLEVNGKYFTNLGKKGRALKNILITKEGLTIKK